MSERNDRQSPDPSDAMPPEDVAELVRSLPTPEPDSDFRAELRRRFVDGSLVTGMPASGELDASAGTGSPAGDRSDPAGEDAAATTPSEALDAPSDPSHATATASAHGAEAPVLRPAWWRRRSTATLAAAAVLLLLAIPLSGASGRGWDVLGIEGSGRVQVDGEWLTIEDQADVDEVARRLRQGARLETEGDVEITVKSQSLVICLQPGACFELPVKSPWWNPTATDLPARLLGGSVHVMTGHPQTDALRIETDDTTVRLGAGMAAVECSPDGTCVLVLKGSARVRGAEGDCVVEEGQRRFPCPVAHHPRIDTLTDEQRQDLDRTDAAWRGSMKD